MTETVEFRVRPVTRFVVTKFVHHSEETERGLRAGVGSSMIGEFDNQELADIVLDALAHRHGHKVKFDTGHDDHGSPSEPPAQ